MARILITGCGGFIGSRLATHLVARGHVVHGIVRAGQNVPDDIERHDIQLEDETAVERCFSEVCPDVIYHLAHHTRRAERNGLQDVLDSLETDVGNLIRLLVVSSRCTTPPRAFIRAGSLAEYGPIPAPFYEGQREQPLNTYAASLVAGTHLAQMLRQRHNLPVLTARMALVYGPGQSEDFLLPRLVANCLKGRCTVLNRPDYRRDLIAIEDIVKALTILGETPPQDVPILNISTGVAPRVRDVAALVVEKTGCDPALVQSQPTLNTSGIKDLRGAADLMREKTGWTALILLSEGVERLVAWYLDQAEKRNEVAS